MRAECHMALSVSRKSKVTKTVTPTPIHLLGLMVSWCLCKYSSMTSQGCLSRDTHPRSKVVWLHKPCIWVLLVSTVLSFFCWNLSCWNNSGLGNSTMLGFKKSNAQQWKLWGGESVLQFRKDWSICISVSLWLRNFLSFSRDVSLYLESNKFMLISLVYFCMDPFGSKIFRKYLYSAFSQQFLSPYYLYGFSSFFFVDNGQMKAW